jgi:hypothetical protein
VGVRPVAQEAVLTARSGKHGHEPAAAVIDVGHLLARAQLAVGDVEEVGATDDLAQLVPRGDVRLIVGRVAVGQAVRDRDRAVGADGQDPQQLLEIAAVILVVTVRRGGGRFARPLMTVGVVVGAAQRDRRRVVVQLRAVDIELGDHAEHQLGQKRSAVSVKQPVKRAADAIVVEQRDVVDR